MPFLQSQKYKIYFKTIFPVIRKSMRKFSTLLEKILQKMGVSLHPTARNQICLHIEVFEV